VTGAETGAADATAGWDWLDLALALWWLGMVLLLVLGAPLALWRLWREGARRRRRSDTTDRGDR